MSKQKNEVLTLEAEEMGIETTINDALIRNNVTETKIAEFRSKYGSLTINGQSDREGYDAVVEARKECKGWRVLATKICKKGREEANNILKAWVAKEKEIVGKISEIEDALEKQEIEWENERERIKLEKKRMQDEAFIMRQAELNRMGVAYNAGSFELGEVSFDSGTIKESDNEIWENNILPKYREQYDKNQAEIAEANRIQAEKDAAIAKEREELERQQRELKAQQEAFERAKAEQERIEREKLEAEQREKMRQQTELQNKRLHQLVQYNQRDMFPGDLWRLSDEEFFSKLSYEKEQYEIREAEKKKKLEEAAAQKERERIAEEQRQAEIRRQQEEQRKAEELALSNDKTKWAVFIKNIEAITHSEMKSSKYKKMQSIAKEKLEEIIQL